jgi:hypothetical protein
LSPPEHRIDAILQPRLTRKLKQESQGFVGDPVLGIVEIDAGGLDSQPLTARAVLGEQLPQMEVRDLLTMLFQRRPGRALAQSWDAHRSFLADSGARLR